MKKRKKLVDSKVIFLFGAGVLLIFSLLFHKSEQLKAMFDIVEADHISLAYLRLLVDMDPADNNSRLALARQYVSVGQPEDAHTTLIPLLDSTGQEAIEGKLLSLELDLNEYFALSALDNTKEKTLSELQSKISAIAKQKIPDTLMAKVIEKSLSLNKPEVAAQLYEQWANLSTAKRFNYLQEAGRWYIAAGKPMVAADMYHKTFATTEDLAEAKQYALLAIRATKAADRGKTGLEYLDDFRLRLPNDQDLLNEAIALSLANNNPKQAFKIGQERLVQDSNNPDLIKKQLELALAVGELDVALALSEKLTSASPIDLNIRLRTAQIAEWAGKPNIALKHLAYLISTGDSDTKTQKDFYRLAAGINDPDPIIEAFSSIINIRMLEDAELNLILGSAYKVSNAKKFAFFLRGYLKQFPGHKNAWITYANAQANAGNITSALETIKHLHSSYNVNDIKLTLLEARLYKKIGQPETAYQRLLSVKNNVNSNEIEFWKTFADISWGQKHSTNAFAAYNLLWHSKGADAVTAERLIQLFRDHKQPKDGIAVAKAAYRKFNEPRWLLLAMDTASQFKSWNDLKELLQVTNANMGKFNKTEMYWLLRAQSSNQNKQYQIALSEYKEALKINPKSKTVKDGIMWNLIGQQDSVNSRIHLATNSLRSNLHLQ